VVQIAATTGISVHASQLYSGGIQMNKPRWALLSVLLLSALCLAQDSRTLAIRSWRQANEHAIISEYVEFLKIPNLAADPANLRRNAATIQQMFEKRGVKSRLLELPGIAPAVYGEIMTPGATRTVMLYAHYDGQPLDPKEWASPPFEPTLRDAPLDNGGKVIPFPAQGQPFGPEWRIYARGSGDDKVNIMLFMAALDALRANKVPFKSNIKFIVEGEEEAGSPHLTDYMRQNKELLSADVWLICDGPMDQSRRQNIVFSVRGVQIVDVTVYGARHELHSGHYGNWAPNPAMMLAQLMASMKDENGRVLIDHFYDGVQPFGELEKKAIAEAPQNDAKLKHDLWLGRTDGNGAPLLELIALPSLNIRGMASSRMGAQASNVIPATASATIDLRLVKGIDKQVQAQRLIEHIRKQGYFVVDKDPDEQTRLSHPKVAKVVVDTGGYNAAGSPMDLPISKLVIQAVENARGPVIKLPVLGASVPLFMIQEVLGSATIQVSTANHDDNQHSYNENIRIQNIWDGIETIAALMTM
jgi:acetylornithine deacetylase/succinyl-diaminopimelate desuccinylase-like protein